MQVELPVKCRPIKVVSHVWESSDRNADYYKTEVDLGLQKTNFMVKYFYL